MDTLFELFVSISSLVFFRAKPKSRLSPRNLILFSCRKFWSRDRDNVHYLLLLSHIYEVCPRAHLSALLLLIFMLAEYFSCLLLPVVRIRTMA